MDDRTSKARSYNMSRIRGKDTKPEEIVRKYLFSKGFRYRKNDKRLPGHPDIVFPKYRTVIFVNGCFWHMHDCKMFVMPKSRIEYWEPKLLRNKKRDDEVKTELEAMGWRVIIVWECELKKSERKAKLISISEKLVQNKLVENNK